MPATITSTPKVDITTFLYVTPSWVIPIAHMILAGSGGDKAENEVSGNSIGDWVLHRKFTANDKEIFPQLGLSDEVWITLERGMEV